MSAGTAGRLDFSNPNPLFARVCSGFQGRSSMGSPTKAKPTRLPLANPNFCRNAHSF